MKRSALFLPFVILPHDGVHSFVFPVAPNGLISLKNSAPLSVATSNPREVEVTNSAIDIDYSSMTTLPRHPDNDDANEILSQTEQALRSMQENVLFAAAADDEANEVGGVEDVENDEVPIDIDAESVYANSYVDLGQVDTVGFDYDYTLVTYTKELLKVIYDMALKRLVEEKDYPDEMLTSGLKFDPFFSIRGELFCFCSY